MLNKFEGPRICLRDWKPEDLAAYENWQKPGARWQELDGPYYKSETDESAQLAADLKQKITLDDFPNPRMRLAIAALDNDQLIGVVSSYWESKETNWLCIGIIIYDDNQWGKGIGAEALKLWIDYLFDQWPEIVRLDMRTWSGNIGLAKLANKLGFTQEACFRKARIVNGQYFDGLGFGILKSEWQSK